jgi:hypothetical protein
VHIALRRPIFADRRRLTERPVVAALSLQSTSELCPAYLVSWLPKGDGPSPEFVGTLAVKKCRRDDCFPLILSGQYKPPARRLVLHVAIGSRVYRPAACCARWRPPSECSGKTHHFSVPSIPGKAEFAGRAVWKQLIVVQI